MLGAPPRWGSVFREGRAYGHLMATEPALEQTLQGPAAWEQEAEREHVHGVGPWRLGLRRLRRNKVAIAFGVLFVLLVLACVAAPLWADNVAKTTATENHLSDTITVDGEKVNVVALDGVPIGPAVAQGRRQVLPRSRSQRTRHHGPAPVRGPQLALDRDRGGLPDDGPLDPLRRDRRLLQGVVRLDHPGGPRRRLVIPRGHPRCRAGCGARAGRDQDRPDRGIRATRSWCRS